MAKKKAECADCGHRCALDALDEYHDFWSRIEPGDVMPAGDCPECGAHSFLMDDRQRLRAAAPGLLETCARILQAIEWSVTKERMTDDEKADMLRAAIAKVEG